MPITFKKYLEDRERTRFLNENGIEEAHQRFMHCKEDRKAWDAQAEFGAMVMANDLSFMDSLLSKNDNKNKIWGDNFIRTNLSTTISHMQASDIKVALVSDKAERTEAQRLLEAEINYTIDKFNMLREDDQALWFMKFMGMAYAYMGWNPLDQDTDWFTGKPFKTAIDPRKVWIDANTEKKDKSDKAYLFHRETFNTEELKAKFPKLREMITENETSEEYRETPAYRLGVTDVMRYQYKRVIPMKRRAIVNETTKKTRYFLEEEYEDYLKTVSEVKGIEVEDIDQLKQMGEFPDETDVFPENIQASKVLDSEITAWYEVLYIDGIKEVAQPPIYVGSECSYPVLAGNFNPNSAYSYGDASRDRDLLEASILMMTIQLFDTIRKYKPIPVFFPGAFLNENDIKKKWGNPNFRLQLNPKFFEEHKNLSPRDCIWTLDQPQVGQLQIALNDRLTSIAQTAENSPDVTKGVQPYAGMPGKSVLALQQAAASSVTTTMTEYAEFMKAGYEKLKILLAENRNYKHTLYTVTEDGNKGDVEVPENGLLDAAYDSYIDIVIEENSEVLKQIKEQKFLQLYSMKDAFGNPLVSKDDLIRIYVPEDAERVIKNNEAQDKQKIIMDIVQNNEMIQNIIANTMQQQQVPNADVEIEEVA